MKGFTTLLIVLDAVALGRAATCSGSKQCQCLFRDGSHCCVYGSVRHPSTLREYRDFEANTTTTERNDW